MHPYVVRRLPSTPRASQPERVTVEPPALGKLLPFKRKPWRERDLQPEVLQHFREARHGDT